MLIGWYLHGYSSDDTVLKTEKVVTMPGLASEFPAKADKEQSPGEKSEPSAAELPVQAVLAEASSSETMPAFEALLKRHLFEGAMQRYADADEEDIAGYQKSLLAYFQTRAKSLPDETIEEIVQFLEIEPENRTIHYMLISLYLQQKEYLRAIDEIRTMKEDYLDERDDKKLEALLKTAADDYIDLLKKRKDNETLLSFLEQMREYDRFRSYYTLQLSRRYFELQQYGRSRELLREIEEDAIYGKEAQNILAKIEKLEEQAKEYEYAIQLQRRGEHFIATVRVNNMTTLDLLLDTGASYTLIDKGSLPSLTVLKKNMTLHTAGGEITADLCQAENFTLQDIELHHFKVMSTSFDQGEIDGLLGMNFFKRFKFFLDQKEAILHLSKKR